MGKLVVEHMVDELEAELVAEVFSTEFPPQVFVRPDGTVKLVNNALYQVVKGPRAGRDLFLLTGDYQGLTPSGQYLVADAVLDLVERYGCSELFTLGGYGLGRLVRKPKVIGAATDIEMVARGKELGVEFREEEPGGGIIGASGLFLGLGKLRGLRGICLMGETSGYLVDPHSAQAVLRVLTKALGLEIELAQLEEKAKEMDRIAQQLRDHSVAVCQTREPGGTMLGERLRELLLDPSHAVDGEAEARQFTTFVGRPSSISPRLRPPCGCGLASTALKRSSGRTGSRGSRSRPECLPENTWSARS